MAAPHLPHQVFLLRGAAFFWFALTIFLGDNRDWMRVIALSLTLYPLLMWALYAVSQRQIGFFQSFFVIDAAIVSGFVVFTHVPFMSTLSALSALSLSSNLCLDKRTWQSKCIRMLLVVTVATQSRYFVDGFKALGFEQSLSLLLLIGFSWGAARLVYCESAARSSIFRATKAEHARVTQQVNAVRPYLPVASLIDAPLETAPKRQILTLFISDLVDSTGTSERQSDDLFTAFLNDYIICMGQLVLKLGGTLDKFTGDGLVVVFGLDGCRPTLAAQRCADMALAMRPALELMLQRWEPALSQLPVGQRVGIHTGDCLVGSFGSPERLNYTVLGRAMHVTARLEQVALPNEILVSAETAGLLDDRYHLQQRLPVKVSGMQSRLMHSALLD